MSRLVFGPKTSGLNVLAIHLGVTVQIFQDPGDPPGCFTLVATSPLGNSTKMTVSNGGSTSLDIISLGVTSVTATIATDDWNPNVPGMQDMCQFKVVIRAQGKVPVGPIQIPVSVQIDAYDVVLHRSMDDFATFIDVQAR